MKFLMALRTLVAVLFTGPGTVAGVDDGAGGVGLLTIHSCRQ